MPQVTSTGGWYHHIMIRSVHRSTLLFGVAIAVGVGAALVLGTYSVKATGRIAELSERSLLRSTRVLGQKLVDRIERAVIDTDRAMFRLVRLENPEEFQALWKRIVRMSPMVRSVVVLDERHRVIHLVSRLGRARRRLFRTVFVREIVPQMDLDRLPDNAHRHLNRAYRDDLHLLSYIKRRGEEGSYTVALDLSLGHVTQELFSGEFDELMRTQYVAVTDDDGRVIYGELPPDGHTPVFRARFPTTLYRWRLTVAPRESSSVRREVRARRTTNLALVVLAEGLILLGMVVLLVAARKERRANRLKSEFVSNVSHELKTPLSLIRMFGELLALGRTRGPEHAREYAEIITREAERLTHLIDNVLDFSRIEQGREAYTFSEGRLGPVVERAVELVRPRAEQAGAQLSCSVEPDLSPVSMDPGALTLLLLNLLDNALKYGVSGDGTARIRVTLARENRELVLSVNDRGPGILESEIPRVFDRFYRGDDARRQRIRGSGIGLSLVRHIAESHGGRVTASNDPEGGCQFMLRLPTS